MTRPIEAGLRVSEWLIDRERIAHAGIKSLMLDSTA